MYISAGFKYKQLPFAIVTVFRLLSLTQESETKTLYDKKRLEKLKRRNMRCAFRICELSAKFIMVVLTPSTNDCGQLLTSAKSQ